MASVLFLVFVLLLIPVGSLQATQNVRWADLTVPILPNDDPTFGLAFEQRQNFEALLAAQVKRETGTALTGDDKATVKRASEALRASGLSGEALLKKEKQFRQKITSQRSSVREEWDDKKIRIPGYVLPLEFDGDLVTEFVLVPYMGACVHVPPPPANQMIIVRHASGFAVAGLFEAVWVTGRLKIARSSRPVNLSDGTASFEVGYVMDAASVRHYAP
ncbi:MAG: DUF3299 domain-containing protein [Hyphomicrobiaceae bacterium]